MIARSARLVLMAKSFLADMLFPCNWRESSRIRQPLVLIPSLQVRLIRCVQQWYHHLMTTAFHTYPMIDLFSPSETLVTHSPTLGAQLCQRPPTENVERFLFRLGFDSRGKANALGPYADPEETKWVSNGSSPFRCLQQQGIKGVLSILSTERFFLKHRRVETRQINSTSCWLWLT